ncbi:hypothetical protein GGR50DRAFT_658019 [Xylaria sp. CBS 124048]|nr:hypothetical protein GGR50DRAFT_658019 [Xylaria sp. CBS 124048]
MSRQFTLKSQAQAIQLITGGLPFSTPQGVWVWVGVLCGRMYVHLVVSMPLVAPGFLAFVCAHREACNGRPRTLQTSKLSRLCTLYSHWPIMIAISNTGARTHGCFY